ncbi:restriction endonuclease subunit S [Enterococcus faecalis]|uniref:restriction endonuclease subunit S n=1 Tax=Enterococcus faecalis TaxID=1351 RepID=UPI001CF32D86|nr:restriction endonuclease subunit S [Enterococcus faecalis]MCA6725405.1 restriction endonuclease subunit S [Enterococcus faecalis]MCA6751667.1 restriction endonuclease subunit S [Enterococcus faecalis]MCB5964612.1 restriction endonuclease subunit S [Enterococcus faecalis]
MIVFTLIGVWELCKFSDFTKLSQGLQIAIVDRFSTPDINREFYITNEFLSTKSTKKYYIENPPATVIADKDDILMTRTGNTGKVVTNTKGAFHNNFFKIAYNKKKTSKLFLYFLLTSPPIQKEILIRAGTSTIPDLNHNDFYKIIVKIPSEKEQQKIGNLLKKIDDIITLHQRKLEQLKELKKAYLQLMFPKKDEIVPRMRFADFEGEWEQCKLKNLFLKGGSGGTPTSSNSDYYNGDIPFLSISDITKSNGYIYTTEKCISLEGLKNSSAWIVPKESISLAMYASVGKVAILKLDIATSQAFYNMIFEDINTRNYIYHYLIKKEVFNEWITLISTGTQANLNADKVKNTFVLIPSNNEQKKIAELLRCIEVSIDIQQEKIHILKSLKKSYLQNMFI